MSHRTRIEKRGKYASFLLLLAYFLLAYPPRTCAQTLADRLGYPPGTKLVIVHADDLGETHAVNAAAIQSLEAGTVNSASMMVPCPWFPEIADYAKSHPGADFGLHLTVTSERVYYRWGCGLLRRVLSRNVAVPSALAHLRNRHRCHPALLPRKRFWF